MDWYEPDDRWEIWNIESKNDFVEKFVVVGSFHSKVPNDVVEAFKTVSYLMAHAYFYYPIYDEAMSKALLVMEMAIKIKAEELGISLKRPPNKKKKVVNKNLSELIDEVCKQNHLTFLKPEFDRARNMRNSKMHPKNHTIYGAMGFTNGNAMLFVNVINKLFLSEEELDLNAMEKEKLSPKFKKFSQGLFVMDFERKRMLITSIYDFKYIKHKGRELLLIYVQPILLNFKEVVKNNNYESLVVALTSFKIEGHRISGVDDNGVPINIYPNQNEANIIIWENFIEEYESINNDDIRQFTTKALSMALWRYEELIYENCW